MESETLTWDEIMEHCSRLHTTRTRPAGPWEGAELREDSKMLSVLVEERPATIVPTRMHEPGFYWRWEDIEGSPKRSDYWTERLRRLTSEGKVTRA